MTDPVGRIVSELRTILAADGGGTVTVRGGRRFEGDETHAGDLPPLVIVRGNSRARNRTDAVPWRLVITSYGLDPRLAMALDSRVSEALHDKGPRFSLGSVAIYRSGEEVGGQPGEDPETHWSSATSVYIVHGSTQTP